MKLLLLSFVGAVMLNVTGCVAVDRDHDHWHDHDHDRTVIIEHHDDDHHDDHHDDHP